MQAKDSPLRPQKSSNLAYFDAIGVYDIMLKAKLLFVKS